MTDTEKDVEEELRLAKQMKDVLCDKSGKEKDPAKAAEIIHKIGLIYRKRSPDKISLIKSVGLFNAAITRNPRNISQIKSDLFEICKHILQQAKAEKQNTDLVEKALHVKMSLNLLREEVEVFFQTSVSKIPPNASKEEFQKLMSNKISAIQHINKIIAKKYEQIMADLSQFCEDVMGKPPCKYAIVGMGSLARKEITPYSDFEHIILLFDDKNYKAYLEYFKWYSTIFHVVVLNVQETIIPSLNVSSLNGTDSKLNNWYYDAITPRGISFDGMMPHACKFPLGRQNHTKHKQFANELIKPVSEMLEYLSSEADLKNGYHLADILTKTCFVFGNKIIFKQFVDGAQNYCDKKNQKDVISNLRQQIKDDLNRFSTRFRLTELNSKDTINIKQLVYRSTTIFIAALASIHNISANSSFDMINKMAQINKITQNTAYKLRCAIAIACEMRLRVYSQKHSQCDNAIDLRQDGIETFLNIVGVVSTVNYFQIAYCLQCEVAKQLNFTKFHFYSDPQLMNITIGLSLRINKDLSSFSKNPQNQFWDFKKFDFDTCIKELEGEKMLNSESGLFQSAGKKISRNYFNVFQNSTDSNLNALQIKSIADYLYSSHVFDEASDFYKLLLDVYQRESNNKSRDFDVAWANDQIGFCLKEVNQSADALKYFNQALDIRQRLAENAKLDEDIAITLHNIGHCLIDMNNYSNALTYLNRALEIRVNLTRNFEKDKSIANTLQNIGHCHIDVHNFDDALTNLDLALAIRQNTTVRAESDYDIAAIFHTIGYYHANLGNNDKALQYLFRALEIKQRTTFYAEKDKSIAMTLNNIGSCYINLNNCRDALEYLLNARYIYQNTSLNVDKDRNFATTLHNIGHCYIDWQLYEEALGYLNQALKIRQNSTLNAEMDRDIASTFHIIAYCHICLRHYNHALDYLNRALKIRQNTTFDPKKDKKIANTLHNIGYCHIDLHNYESALSYLNAALEIYQNATLGAETDKNIAMTLHEISRCSID